MSASRFNPMALSGRRFLVTGAASGIGRAIAILISKLDARVIITDCNPSGLQETFQHLDGEGHAAREFDLKNISDISSWMESLIADGGGLNGFIHAAGLFSVMPARLLTPEKWREVLLINTESALALVKGFLGRTIYKGENGSIVFISSVMSLVGSPGAVAYSLSKGALNSMTRSLALELAPKHIRVNCVAPGFYYRKIRLAGLQHTILQALTNI